jgi:hypothetical protein
MKRSMLITWLVSGVVTLSLFQNCAQVNFADSASLNGGQKTSIPDDPTGSGDPDPTPTPTPPQDPTPTPNPTPEPPVATPTPPPVVDPTPTPTPGMPDPTPTPEPTPVPPQVGKLKAVFDPAVVPNGSKSEMKITAEHLDRVSYECLDKSGGSISKGTLDLASATSKSLVIDRDLDCSFVGTSSEDSRVLPVNAVASVSVACGNQIKTAGGRCEDFVCKSVVEIKSDDLLKVPSRTSEGICYAYKLMSQISNSSSDLTKDVDSTILARNHGRKDDGGAVNARPFVMGKFAGDFKLNGARVVKLAGGVDDKKKILVDNFILTGVYPKDTAKPFDLRKYYKVTGSSDAAIKDSAGKNLGYIQFNNENLDVQAFASGGTSSIAPIDITAFATPNVVQTLDIRALDCGGVRELSDIYLLFQ